MHLYNFELLYYFYYFISCRPFPDAELSGDQFGIQLKSKWKKECLIKSQFNLILLDNIQICSSKPHRMRSHHMLAGLQPNWAAEGYQAYPTDCICSQDPLTVADH